MISTFSAFIILAASIHILANEKSSYGRRRRKWWISPLIEKRSQEGTVEILLTKALSHGFHYKNYLRLDKATFRFLLSEIEPLLTRRATHLRRPVSAAHRLAVTLRFLATGLSSYLNYCIIVA